MTEPFVSIVVPLYNGEAFITDAIESILSQTYTNYEIIVIDDGSTDGSRQLLIPFFDKISYVYKPNGGIASAYNAGVRISKGELVAFLEQDDIWAPTRLEQHVQYLKRHPDTGMVYSRYFIVDLVAPNDSELSTLNLQGQCFVSLFTTCLEKGSILPFSAVTVLRNVLEQIGELDTDLRVSVDYDTWLRIAFAYAIGFIDAPLFTYRLHGENTSAAPLPALVDEEKILEKWITGNRIRGIVPGPAIRDRLCRLFVALAYQYRSTDNIARERFYRRKVLLLAPFHLKSWRNYIMSFFDRSSQSVLSWYWHKVFGLFSSDIKDINTPD
jgi:glycosyltransferase involved in cell wall biosynthesis